MVDTSFVYCASPDALPYTVHSQPIQYRIDYNSTTANDKIHDAVVQALKNDGWHILRELFSIRYEELEIRVDIVAEQPAVLAEKDGRRILVEIKSFGGRSFMKDLQNALGQYMIYRNILALSELEYELFLAYMNRSTMWRFNRRR